MHKEIPLIYECSGLIKSNLRKLKYHHQKIIKLIFNWKMVLNANYLWWEDPITIKKKFNDIEIVCEKCGVFFKENNRVSHLRSLVYRNKPLTNFGDD